MPDTSSDLMEQLHITTVVVAELSPQDFEARFKHKAAHGGPVGRGTTLLAAVRELVGPDGIIDGLDIDHRIDPVLEGR